METMSAREQARHQAQAKLAAIYVAEDNEWDVEMACEAGWDYIEQHPNATVEEVQAEAQRQKLVRQQEEAFRLSFISAALGGVEGLLR